MTEILVLETEMLGNRAGPPQSRDEHIDVLYKEIGVKRDLAKRPFPVSYEEALRWSAASAMLASFFRAPGCRNKMPPAFNRSTGVYLRSGFSST